MYLLIRKNDGQLYINRISKKGLEYAENNDDSDELWEEDQEVPTMEKLIEVIKTECEAKEE